MIKLSNVAPFLGLLLGLVLGVFLASPAAAGELEGCDRNYDDKITILDAHITLDSVVASCRVSLQCDADGDDEDTVTDALALLRSAVGLPVELDCECTYIDECFNDEDCDWEPGFVCGDFRCGECDGPDDCAEDEDCDGCHMQCVPKSQ